LVVSSPESQDNTEVLIQQAIEFLRNNGYRRIVHDARERGYNAVHTIGEWESVRRGEKQHIFPYQENADVMFNSALAYELRP
jgi:uridine kinase